MKKFTLIELLIVTAIIGILISLLLPSLTKARYKAMKAVCLSNLKQSGNAMMIYMKDSSMGEHHLYFNFTGDHPFEGTVSRKGKHGPGNPAMWTLPYLEGRQSTYKCPLVSHEQEYTVYPEDEGGIWGDYIYLYGKAVKSDDPWKSTRNRHKLHTSLKNVNSESEDVVLTDYPAAKAIGNFPEWKMSFIHYNALMKDNSAKTAAYKDIQFYKWLFGNTSWGG